MKLNAKTLLIACAAVAALTWYLCSGSDERPPRPDERPVLRFVARWAKTLLWVAVFADPPPEEAEPIQQAVGRDGYPQLSHARSL